MIWNVAAYQNYPGSSWSKSWAQAQLILIKRPGEGPWLLCVYSSQTGHSDAAGFHTDFWDLLVWKEKWRHKSWKQSRRRGNSREYLGFTDWLDRQIRERHWSLEGGNLLKSHKKACLRVLPWKTAHGTKSHYLGIFTKGETLVKWENPLFWTLRAVWFSLLGKHKPGLDAGGWPGEGHQCQAQGISRQCGAKHSMGRYSYCGGSIVEQRDWSQKIN